MIFKKIRKGHADWRNFLCSTPARDYVFQKDAYEDQIDRAAKNIRNTDCVIILRVFLRVFLTQLVTLDFYIFHEIK